MRHENGIQTEKVPLTRNLFRRALRASREGQDRELKRIVTSQFTKMPRPDPDDILTLDFEKAPRKMRKPPTSYAVVAIVEVARGQRVLADFVLEHTGPDSPTPSAELGDEITTCGKFIVGGDGDDVLVECPCGGQLRLSRRSLRGTTVPEEEERIKLAQLGADVE